MCNVGRQLLLDLTVEDVVVDSCSDLTPISIALGNRMDSALRTEPPRNLVVRDSAAVVPMYSSGHAYSASVNEGTMIAPTPKLSSVAMAIANPGLKGVAAASAPPKAVIMTAAMTNISRTWPRV